MKVPSKILGRKSDKATYALALGILLGGKGVIDRAISLKPYGETTRLREVSKYLGDLAKEHQRDPDPKSDPNELYKEILKDD